MNIMLVYTKSIHNIQSVELGGLDKYTVHLNKLIRMFLGPLTGTEYKKQKLLQVEAMAHFLN